MKIEINSYLINSDVVRFGDFKLASGKNSPIYVDLRILPSYPSAFDKITDAMADAIRKLKPTVIAGAETAGIPLAAAVALKMKLPMVYVRKKPKEYGTRSMVEGVLKDTDKVVLIDDLITDGGSKLAFINGIRGEGAKISDVFVVLDREQGGKELLMKNGIELHSLTTLKDLLDYLLNAKRIDEKMYAKVMSYLGEQG